MLSCGEPDAVPSSCGLGEVGGWTPTDGEIFDCDDHDRAVSAPVTWYVDCDGDGFAPPGLGTVVGCEAPEEAPVPCGTGGDWTEVEPIHAPFSDTNTTTDCGDDDEVVRPDQTEWFTSPAESLPAGSEFDFNCSGESEPEVASVYRCSVSMPGPMMYNCISPIGEAWMDRPACGGAGTLVDGCDLIPPSLTSCRPSSRRDSVLGCH